jgi:hypothetical protein
MVESRWVRRVGPGLAAVLAVAAVATTTLGARGAPWEPPPCPGGKIEPTEALGSWWRMDPRLVDGRLVGQRLTLGGPGGALPRGLDLPAESFAAGPVRGQVLVGTDDGVHSTLRLIDVERGCATVVGMASNVIRRAVIAPDLGSIVEFRVTRDTRADLGVFERPLAARAPVRRILGPIGADARFGPTWTTELAWSTDGRRLAVQSCGGEACRTRILDRTDRTVDLVADPDLGDMVGLAGTRLVVRAACGGLPCALIAVDIADGTQVTLHPEAGLAMLTVGIDGRPTVVHEVGADAGALRSVGIDGRGARNLPADPSGRRVVDGPGRAGAGAESGRGLVVLGPDGRIPVDGPDGAIVRRLSDGASLRFDEVTR